MLYDFLLVTFWRKFSVQMNAQIKSGTTTLQYMCKQNFCDTVPLNIYVLLSPKNPWENMSLWFVGRIVCVDDSIVWRGETGKTFRGNWGQFVLLHTHCPKTNMIPSIETDPVTAGADATVYCTSGLCMAAQYMWTQAEHIPMHPLPPWQARFLRRIFIQIIFGTVQDVGQKEKEHPNFS